MTHALAREFTLPNFDDGDVTVYVEATVELDADGNALSADIQHMEDGWGRDFVLSDSERANFLCTLMETAQDEVEAARKLAAKREAA